jgi:HPr kinase/phosphorylase
VTGPDAGVQVLLHATAVAARGRGLLILGRSGAGKSSLALQLIALGAALVADDRTRVTLGPKGLVASPPDTIRGRIEARGIGLLTLPHEPEAPLSLAVDLDEAEPARLPHPHHVTILGHRLPCLRRAEGPHFPAAVLMTLTAPLTNPDEP